MIRAVLILTVCALSQSAPRNLDITQVVDIQSRIISDGYPSETHHVVTSDGYILEINRIPHGRFNGDEDEFNRPVVFLMHGLQTFALSFTILGSNSIAYNLADAGFDVWMGNARGIMNSRNHISLNPEDKQEKKEFFDFSFEDIGLIDVPTMVDYVLKNTGRKQLHYIGHSQGGTAFLALTSVKPEYNEKFKSVHLLAGVGYQNYFPNELLKTISDKTDEIYLLATLAGQVELFGPKVEQNANAALSPADDATGTNSRLDALRTLIEFISTAFRSYEIMAGASLKQYAHYGQNIKDKSFRRWNYGSIGNLLNYGRLNPPEFDLSLVTAPVTMHYTVSDNLLDERDVLAMVEVMPNTRARKVARDSFLHTSFMVSPDVKDLVTNHIISEIKSNYLCYT